MNPFAFMNQSDAGFAVIILCAATAYAIVKLTNALAQRIRRKP